jgi:hypothetical protein
MQYLFLQRIILLFKLNLMSVTKGICSNSIQNLVVLFFIERNETHKLVSGEL